MSKKLPTFKYQFGFNLVELLVVLSIMGILFSMGYANYRGFARRQALSNTSKNIQADLRLAQATSLSAQVPVDVACTGGNDLKGYLFTVIPPNQYEIRPSCSGVGVISPKKSVTLPNGITFTSGATSILFKVLGSGTNLANGSTVTITISQTGTNPVSVTVTSGGQIQ